MKEKSNELEKMLTWFKDNLVIIVSVLLFACVSWLVPYACGDDFAYRNFYKSIENAPIGWVWDYFFYNGRGTQHFIFGLCTYYEDAWFLVTPICIIFIFKSIETLLNIRNKLSQLVVLALSLTFSWTICKEIFFWPIGNAAYLPGFALMLFIFAQEQRMITNNEKSITKIFIISFLLFLIAFGAENIAVGLIIGSIIFILYNWNNKNSRLISLVCGIGACIGSIACLVCPAGQRLQYEMGTQEGNLLQMVVKNIYTIIGDIFYDNAFIFCILGFVLIAVFRQNICSYKRNTLLQISKWIIYISEVLFINAILYNWIGESGYGGQYFVINKMIQLSQYLNSIAFCNLLSVIFWIMYLIVIVLPAILYTEENDFEKMWMVSLLGFAIFSVGCFVVLPIVYERSFFNALFVIIFYCAFWLSKIQIESKKIKKVVYFLIFVIVLRVDKFMFNLVPVHQVAVERRSIAEEYRKMNALGLVDDIKTIYFPKYPNNSISWGDDAINPQKEDSYQYDTMKEYYGIPDDVDVIFR